MKKLYLYIGVVITIFTFGVITLFPNEFFEQFNLRRLTANFYGSCFNQSTLIVYGDGGIILRTTDWGKNWHQISLNDSLCIIDMVHFDNKFIGISRFRYLLFSTDEGITWELKDFGPNTRFYKVFPVENQLIVATRGKVLLMEKDLRLIKEFEIPRKESFYRDEHLEVMSLANNYLLFQYSDDEMCLLSWKNGTYQTFKVSFPQNTIIRQIIPQLGGAYLYFANEAFYELNLETKQLTHKVTLPTAFSRVFTSYVNNIYMFCNYYNKRFNIDSLFFGRFQGDTTFEKIDTGVDRYINQLSFTNINFKNQDTIIAVGLYKLIMISTDGGKSWTLNSLFNFEREFYSTISNIYLLKDKYLRTLGKYLCFFSSNDTGTTWLPPKPIKINFEQNSDFLSESPRIGTYLSEEEGFYFADVLYIKEPNFAFTADGGNSFSFDTNLSVGNSNPFVPPHLIKYKNQYLFATSGKWQVKNEWKIKNHFRKINITPEGLQLETISVDSSVQFIFIHNVNDTLYAIVQKELAGSFSDTLFVYASYDGSKTWDSLYPIYIKRRTTQTLYISSYFKFGDTLFVVIVSRKDKYDPNINSLEDLYYLNFRERIFRKFIEFDSSTFSIRLQKVGKYYILEANFYKDQAIRKILFSKNLDLPINKWRELFINPRYIQREPFPMFYTFANDLHEVPTSLRLPIVEMEENTCLIQTFDNYHKTPIIFLAKLKPNSILWADTIETDSVNIPDSELFVTRPYPLPTRENITFRVYYNPAYDFEQIDFYATDVLGKIVAESNLFEKIPLTNHLIEVRGSLKNLAQGVYFVIVKLQNTIKRIPIVIIE